MAIPGIGDVTAELLYQDGFKSAEELAGSDVERVTQVEGVSADKAAGIVKAAQAHVEQKRIESEARAVEEAARAADAAVAAEAALAAEAAAAAAQPADAESADEAESAGSETEGTAGGRVGEDTP